MLRHAGKLIMLSLRIYSTNSSKSCEVAKLPVPFCALTAGEDGGIAGYLRFIDESDSKGIRGALYIGFSISGILAGAIKWNLL